MNLPALLSSGIMLLAVIWAKPECLSDNTIYSQNKSLLKGNMWLKILSLTAYDGIWSRPLSGAAPLLYSLQLSNIDYLLVSKLIPGSQELLISVAIAGCRVLTTRAVGMLVTLILTRTGRWLTCRLRVWTMASLWVPPSR